MELGLPRTGLDKFESLVKVPDFSGTFSRDDYVGNQTSHFQQHFASQILLRRLIVSFHGVLSNGEYLGYCMLACEWAEHDCRTAH
jgi:hypothetical protein